MISASMPTITLYTSHSCPYAHRAHITLKELDIPYEEVLIDLEKPREPWYLEKVNPRGLIPALEYQSDEIGKVVIVESAIIAQFLADAHPSHLSPVSNEGIKAAYTRSRINYFIDTYNTKVASYMMQLFMAQGDAKEEKSKQWVAAWEKEIEPLLEGADPFFMGSKEMTMAEVHVAPFIIRLYSLSNGDIFPVSLKEGIEKLPNISKWAKAVMAKESVTYIWDEEYMVRKGKEKITQIAASIQAKQAK
ncbi:thioredoxin-like protein [Aulographum hederae CBS 113979]|uniref:Thioredoxin-like protein n=1 Tax=Aulographum hederae CBS 113979 TaxID=1176131 RepID=A0A6G1H9W2_9PEZI|nr:thioredoxin-like protein [Aulographum hederae CBS 113979]